MFAELITMTAAQLGQLAVFVFAGGLIIGILIGVIR